MGILNLFAERKENSFNYRLILDIGTEFLKAAVIEFNQKEKNILGFGRVKQGYGNMDGGAITNITGVITNARDAVEKALNFTPYRPKRVISGIAGEFIKGVLIFLERPRTYPQRRITEKEIKNYIYQGQQKAYKKAMKKAERETGFKDLQLELINYSLVEIKVDGYKVNNPYQFQGANISLTVFYSFAPLVQLGAIRTIVDELGYELESVVADPLAVANSIMSNEAYEFGAIIIDIGGGTTDIALIRNGGIEGTRMFAMGGRSFTRTLANNLKINLRDAEKIKLAYSADQKIEKYSIVDRLIKSDLEIMYQGIELSLADLARGEALPRNVYFCGGGSGLKGLLEGFKRLRLTEKLPFVQEPNIKILKGLDIKLIEDRTDLLQNVEHTTPRSLSYYGTTIINKERRLMDLESKRL